MSDSNIWICQFRQLSVRFLTALFVLAQGARTLQAIEIENPLWGFDGQVVTNRFNPLSILVSNPSAVAFEDSLHLRKSAGGLQRVGEDLEEPVYIAPFTSRWVQFYPYLKSDFEEWELSWGRGRSARYKLPQPRHGDPARVLIAEADRGLGTGGALKHFPDNLFPVSVTGTDALSTAVLAHVPRWEENRRQAFQDWLGRGGTLHLLTDVAGKQPQFSGVLAELNTPLDRFQVGAGTVVRHARALTQMDRAWVDRVIVAELPELPPDELDADLAQQRGAGQTPEQAQQNTQKQMALDALEPTLFANLKSMTRPDHNWVLINFMSLIYVLLIFPGCYLLGRWRMDYRLVYGALLGSVVLFSFGFAIVGRRGYGEATAVHSVAIARLLPGGAWDVHQWSDVFVTDGDLYTIAHGGTGRIYATCQDAEEVRGVVRNGAEGQFVVDIPPFSSRTFAHRVKYPASIPWDLSVKSGQAHEKLEALVLATGPDFPAQPEQVFALYGGYMHRMTYNEGLVTLTDTQGSELDSWLQNTQQQQAGFNPRYPNWNTAEQTPEQTFQNMGLPLVMRALDLEPPRKQPVAYKSDQVRLFIYARMPPTFFIENERLGKQAGYVLYCADVKLPENP